jgi:uncharacterized membrane protein YfcA
MKKKILHYVTGAAAGFVNGLFGAAGGTVLVACMEKLLKYEPHKAHASAIAVVLPMSILSSLIYVKNVKPDFSILLFVIIGGVFGGIVGAKLLKKISSVYLHKIFGIFMCIMAVKMLI